MAADAIDSRALAEEIEAELRAHGDPARAVAERRYLKSDLTFIGVSVPASRGVAKAVRRRYPDLDRGAVLDLVQALWQAPVHERRVAAVELLILYLERLTPDDLALIERLLRESRTWALVDGLAPGVAGALIGRYPHLLPELDRWAADPDLWLRRSALLALLPGLRRDAQEFPRFSRYADAMLEEREFFIRKAIGWLLREVGRRQPALVAEWLAPRTGRASGITVREAVRWLPDDRREALLAAYRERRPATG